MRIPVLGVPFDAVTLPQAVACAGELLSAGRGGMIATVNPEILLRCRRDSRLAAHVRQADLILADGIGVVVASRILGTPLPERVTGADLATGLFPLLEDRGGSVFLYGAQPGVGERACKKLRRRYPALHVAGTANGYTIRSEDVCRAIELAAPQLVLVGLGSPRQERFIAEYRSRLRCVMIGVGGFIDVLAGDIPRAPLSWQRANAEWLYRLACEPQRLFRTAKLPEILLLSVLEKYKNGAPKGPADP